VKLIEAAETVFATEGFGGTRLEDIAREAEVSPGLMSQYWPGGKLALFADVRKRIRDENVALTVSTLEEEASTTAELIMNMVAALVAWHHSRVDAWRILAPEPMVALDDDEDSWAVQAMMPRPLSEDLKPAGLDVSRGIAQAFRYAMEVMHRDAVAPEVAAVTMSLFVVGLLDGAAVALGGRLDGADDAYAYAAEVASLQGGDPDPVEVALEIAKTGWPPLLLPSEPPPWVAAIS